MLAVSCELLLFAGWANRRQLEVIDYLKEVNRVLRGPSDRGRLGTTALDRRLDPARLDA